MTRMTGRGRVQETIGLVMSVGVVCCLLFPTAQPFSLHKAHTNPTIHRVAKKHSNFDLAFMQMYQLCDRDRNGRFSQRELRCVGDMLRLLIGVRY